MRRRGGRGKDRSERVTFVESNGDIPQSPLLGSFIRSSMLHAREDAHKIARQCSLLIPRCVSENSYGAYQPFESGPVDGPENRIMLSSLMRSHLVPKVDGSPQSVRISLSCVYVYTYVRVCGIRYGIQV